MIVENVIFEILSVKELAIDNKKVPVISFYFFYIEFLQNQAEVSVDCIFLF